MGFDVEYYETVRGRRPIDKDMLHKIKKTGDVQTAKRLAVCLVLLEKIGLRAQDGVVHKLRDDIWSITVCDYRVLCFGDGSLIVCTSAFKKEKNEAPDREIERAKKIRKDWYEQRRTKE